MSAAGELNWEEIEELVKGSYALIAKSPKQPRK
jgi:predicted DNA-binding protein (MmcQ/YjbR family)